MFAAQAAWGVPDALFAVGAPGARLVQGLDPRFAAALAAFALLAVNGAADARHEAVAPLDPALPAGAALPDGAGPERAAAP